MINPFLVLFGVIAFQALVVVASSIAFNRDASKKQEAARPIPVQSAGAMPGEVLQSLQSSSPISTVTTSGDVEDAPVFVREFDPWEDSEERLPDIAMGNDDVNHDAIAASLGAHNNESSSESEVMEFVREEEDDESRLYVTSSDARAFVDEDPWTNTIAFGELQKQHASVTRDESEEYYLDPDAFDDSKLLASRPMPQSSNAETLPMNAEAATTTNRVRLSLDEIIDSYWQGQQIPLPLAKESTTV